MDREDVPLVIVLSMAVLLYVGSFFFLTSVGLWMAFAAGLLSVGAIAYIIWLAEQDR